MASAEAGDGWAGRRLPIELPSRRSVGLTGAAVLVTVVLSVLLVREPSWAVLAVAALVAAPLAMLRPDLLTLGLVPMSLLVGVYQDGFIALAGLAALVGVGVTSAHLLRPEWDRRGGYVLLVGLLLLLLTASLLTGDRAAYFAPALPPDFLGLLIGLLVLTVALLAPPQPLALARVIVVCGAATAGYAVLTGSYANGRLMFTMLNANFLGALLAAATATGVALARRAHPGWLVPAAACAVGLVLTHSRGGLVAGFAGVLVALIAELPNRRRIPAAVAGAVAFGAVFVVAGPLQDAAFGQRSATELSTNNEIRTRAGELALDLAWQHPIRGVGYALFPYLAAGDPRVGVYINTHNDYVRLAAEAGVATLLVFVALLAFALTATGWRRLLPLRAAVAAGAVTLLFVNALSNVLVSVGFWACLGCLLAYRSAWLRGRPRHAWRRRKDA